MVNLAHGDLGILAAFVALFIVQSLGLPLLWASVVTIIVMFLVGYVLQRGLLNHTLGRRRHAADRGHLRPVDHHPERAASCGSRPTRRAWTPAPSRTSASRSPTSSRSAGIRSSCSSSPSRSSPPWSCSSPASSWAGPSGPRPTTVRPPSSWASTTSTSTRWPWPSRSPSSRSPASCWPSARRSTRPRARSASSTRSRRSSWAAWAPCGARCWAASSSASAQTVGTQAFGAGWGLVVGHLVFLTVLAVRPSGFFAKTVTA